ncbi:ABC transporter permease [Plebeiibacterium marinum]|uniref:ABC transporter permease n=1 Tax=Plebeiibacterium marinum TaxID=2992111 RepID=A0AAE3SII1_9BACT|nr:ABC transporter permease [Plebeiobacterium marinum]MCW3804414.1 ABC transporter permease [Plebeiobacterium marinum]
MIKHYFKLALRNFKHNKLIFFGSLITVILCTLCISLLFTYVHNEFTMDGFHKRGDDIYVMTNKSSNNSQTRLIEVRKFFKFNSDNYPEIDEITSVMKYHQGDMKFAYQNHTYTSGGLVVDTSFFNVFDFKLTIGNEKTILSDPEALILTERFANKIFKDKNPIGQQVKVTSRSEKIYTVKAIAHNPPSNSSFEFDYIISTQSGEFHRSGADFILVNDGFDKDTFCEAIKNIGDSHFQFKESITGVMPFKEIYWDESNLVKDRFFSKKGDRKNIKVLFLIAAVIFIISLLNFSNLQIININDSLKTIGVNKIVGAGRRQIFFQKTIELELLVFVSVIILTVLFMVALPFFNELTEVTLNPAIWKIFVINLAILVSLVATSIIYPAFVYLRIPIITTLKNQISEVNQIVGRKIIVTAQFALSFVLLIASVVVIKQLNLMMDKDLGFYSDHILRVKMIQEPLLIESREEAMKQIKKAKENSQYVNNELQAHCAIKGFTQGNSPIEPFSMPWKKAEGQLDYTTQNGLSVNTEYSNLFGLQLVEGRFFEKGRDQQRGDKVVINEAAKKFWNIQDITRERLLNKYWSRNKSGGFQIIGVVRDFNFEHLSVKPQPLVMVYFDDIEADYFIHLDKGALNAGIEKVRELFVKNNPGQEFNYSFLSDEVGHLYHKEKRLSKIYVIFTIIALLISSLGMFTISLYDIRKRTKEIGVRKVNGATVSEILILLNQSFVKWVLLAFVIGSPIAYFLMDNWLKNFAYKTELSWWIFISSGVFTLGIVVLIVTWQSWKASTKNPVEALRYE